MQYNFIINFFFIFTLNGHIKKLKSKFTSDYIICLQFLWSIKNKVFASSRILLHKSIYLKYVNLQIYKITF